MVRLIFLVQILLLAKTMAVLLEPPIQVVEFSKMGTSCAIRATTLYFTVQCRAQFYIYSHTEGVINELKWQTTDSPVSQVHETLDQGISFVVSETLHHYDSLGQHSEVPQKGEQHYFITDQLNVLRNEAESYTKFYVGERLIRSLVMPAGLPYLFSATKQSQDLVQILACIKQNSTCWFYELVMEPQFTLTRMHEFYMNTETTDQLKYTGRFVAHVSMKVLRVYAVFDYILTRVYEEAGFISDLWIEQIAGTGTNNIFKRGTGTVQDFKWNWIDTIQFTNFQYQKISPRAVYDRHQFSFVFPYSKAHAAEHLIDGVSVMNDLVSYDSSQHGLFMLGNHGASGMAVYYQPITVQTEQTLSVFETLKQCIAGQFQQEDGTCKACMVGCQFCIEYTTCQQCFSSLIMGANGVCTCGDRTYQNGKECVACTENCTECTAAGCTSCEIGYMTTEDGQCVPFACEEGKFQKSKTVYECLNCPDGCSNCQNPDDPNDNSCRLCKAGYELVNGVCKKCANNQYSDGSKCENCISPCLTCASAGKCLTCEEGKVMVDAEAGFCQACEQGTFYQAGACLPCVDNCVNCFQANQCTSCVEDFIKKKTTVDNLKIESCEQCPQKFFKFNATYCESCIQHCNSCDSSTSCNECQVGKLFSDIEIQCLDIICPENTYLQGNTCLDCTEGCKTCSSTCAADALECADPPTCDVCQDGFELIEGVCSECIEGTYFDPETRTCQLCGETCKTCTIEGCATCPANMILKPVRKICEVCPDGTYFQDGVCAECSGPCGDCAADQFWDNANQECINCQENCLACNSITCLKCKAEYKILPEGGCEQCPVGTKYDQEKNKCVACSANCLECTAAAGCTKCADKFVNKAGKCSACPALTFFNAGVCENCSQDCLECDSTGCLKCKPEIVLTEFKTCQVCPAQTFFVNNQCAACGDNCEHCTATGCLTCEDQYVLRAGACSQCTGATYFKDTKCVQCPQNCVSCTETECMGCKENFLLQNNECVFQCPEGFYGTADQQCIACLDGCKTCVQQDCSSSNKACSATKCIECDENKTLINGICLECAAGTYKSEFDFTCKVCPENCYHCLNKEECLECSAGYVRDTIQKEVCVLNCGDSVNIRNPVCLQGLGVSAQTGNLTNQNSQSNQQDQNKNEINLVSDTAITVFVAFIVICIVILIAGVIVCIYIYQKEKKKVIPNKFPNNYGYNYGGREPQDFFQDYRDMDSNRQMIADRSTRRTLQKSSESFIKVRTKPTTKQHPMTPDLDNDQITLRSINPKSFFSYDNMKSPAAPQKMKQSTSSITLSDNMQSNDDRPKFLDFPDMQKISAMARRNPDQQLFSEREYPSRNIVTEMQQYDYESGQLNPNNLMTLNDSSIQTQKFRVSNINYGTQPYRMDTQGQMRLLTPSERSQNNLPVISISNIESQNQNLSPIPANIYITNNKRYESSESDSSESPKKSQNFRSKSVVNRYVSSSVMQSKPEITITQLKKSSKSHLIDQDSVLSKSPPSQRSKKSYLQPPISQVSRSPRSQNSRSPQSQVSRSAQSHISKKVSTKSKASKNVQIQKQNKNSSNKKTQQESKSPLREDSAQKSVNNSMKKNQSQKDKVNIPQQHMTFLEMPFQPTFQDTLSELPRKQQRLEIQQKHGASKISMIAAHLKKQILGSDFEISQDQTDQVKNQTESVSMTVTVTEQVTKKESAQNTPQTPRLMLELPQYDAQYEEEKKQEPEQSSQQQSSQKKSQKGSIKEPQLYKNEFTFQQNPRKESKVEGFVNFEQSKIDDGKGNFEISKIPSYQQLLQQEKPLDHHEYSIQREIQELGLEEETSPNFVHSKQYTPSDTKKSEQNKQRAQEEEKFERQYETDQSLNQNFEDQLLSYTDGETQQKSLFLEADQQLTPYEDPIEPPLNQVNPQTQSKTPLLTKTSQSKGTSLLLQEASNQLELESRGPDYTKHLLQQMSQPSNAGTVNFNKSPSRNTVKLSVKSKPQNEKNLLSKQSFTPKSHFQKQTTLSPTAKQYWYNTQSQQQQQNIQENQFVHNVKKGIGSSVRQHIHKQSSNVQNLSINLQPSANPVSSAHSNLNQRVQSQMANTRPLMQNQAAKVNDQVASPSQNQHRAQSQAESRPILNILLPQSYTSPPSNQIAEITQVLQPTQNPETGSVAKRVCIKKLANSLETIQKETFSQALGRIEHGNQLRRGSSALLMQDVLGQPYPDILSTPKQEEFQPDKRSNKISAKFQTGLKNKLTKVKQNNYERQGNLQIEKGMRNQTKTALEERLKMPIEQMLMGVLSREDEATESNVDLYKNADNAFQKLEILKPKNQRQSKTPQKL